jgi:hypothetical protein
MRSARRIEPFPVLLLVAGLAVVFLGAGTVLAQTPPPSGTPPASPAAPSPTGVGIVAPPPSEPPTEFGFEWGIPPEQHGTKEQEFYPERVPTVHQPAFLRGATKTVRTSRTSGVRWGLSGWTAPRIPFDMRESSGGAAFGISIEWGTPLEPPAEPAPPPQR